MKGAAMDFAVVSGLFLMLLVGLVLVVQGVSGKEPPNPGQLADPYGHRPTGMVHPPERHRLRLTLLGVGTIVASLLLFALWSAASSG
jgi:hypothetical protein